MHFQITAFRKFAKNFLKWHHRCKIFQGFILKILLPQPQISRGSGLLLAANIGGAMPLMPPVILPLNPGSSWGLDSPRFSKIRLCSRVQRLIRAIKCRDTRYLILSPKNVESTQDVRLLFNPAKNQFQPIFGRFKSGTQQIFSKWPIPRVINVIMGRAQPELKILQAPEFGLKKLTVTGTRTGMFGKIDRNSKQKNDKIRRKVKRSGSF